MKIALIGYGKMGRMIEEIAVARGHEVVCVIDVDNQGDFDSEAFRTADVAIEFTAPHVAYDNCLKAFRHHVKVVSGSTGWMEQHRDEMRELCANDGQTLFWSSNYSLGVTIFRAVNRYLARIMNAYDAYRPKMEEVHHVHKLDHPSGTAITLAEELVDRVDRLKGWCAGSLTQPDGTVEDAGPAQDDRLDIDSIRRGEVPGIHSITWDSDFDSITITHDAHNRRGFALGAVLAAEYTVEHSGLLGMDDMLTF